MKTILTILSLILLCQFSLAAEESVTLDEYDIRMLTPVEKQTLRLAKEIRKKREERKAKLSGSKPVLDEKAESPSFFKNGAVIQPTEQKSGKIVTINAENLPLIPLAKMYSSLTKKEVMLSKTTSDIIISLEMEGVLKQEAIIEIEKSFRDAGLKLIKLEEGPIILTKTI